MQLITGITAAAALIAVMTGVAVPPLPRPRGGGTLTYMIPADAPPSFDGHRESTFATGAPTFA